LILIDETNNYAIRVTTGSTVYHHSGHIQIATSSDTYVDMRGNSINILEVTSGYIVYLFPTTAGELRETNGKIIVLRGNRDGSSWMDASLHLDNDRILFRGGMIG